MAGRKEGGGGRDRERERMCVCGGGRGGRTRVRKMELRCFFVLSKTMNFLLLALKIFLKEKSVSI